MVWVPKIFRKSRQLNDDDFVVSSPPIDRQCEVILTDPTEDSGSPSPARSAPVVEAPGKHNVQSLPAISSRLYLPSVLTHPPEEHGGDMGLFLSYLKEVNISEHSRAEYMRDLRIWARKLDGSISASAIQAILESLSPHYANRLLASLRHYARYRNFHGDPRLIITLAASLKIRRQGRPKPRAPHSSINGEQPNLYWLMAARLCRKRERAGIFIALALLGVQPAEMRRLEHDGNYVSFIRRGKVVNVQIPQWLSQALAVIDKSRWSLSRTVIGKELRKHGITARDLNHCGFEYFPPHPPRRRRRPA
jgi:hypothetical protein